MSNSVLRRPLASLLSLLMVIGLFTVCGFGTLAADATENAVIQSWDASQLDAAASAKGTQNVHEKAIYQKLGAPIGRRVSCTGGSWLFHTVLIPRAEFNEGDVLELQLKVWFNNTEYGNVMPIEPQWVPQKSGAEVQSTKTYIADTAIDAAPVLTDEALGYQYKEVSAEYTVVAADVQEGVTEMQLRAFLNGDEDVNCYGGKVVNKTTGNTIFDWDGAAICALGSHPSTSTVEIIRNDKDAYLVSYSGPESYTDRTGEPYASYNCDGIEDGQAILMDSLGATLEEGRYAFAFNMASQFSLGSEKVTYRAKDGDKVLAEYTVTVDDVASTVGTDSGIYETRYLPFTVDQESAGHTITFEIVLHNSTDYFLKGVTLEKYFDPVSYTAAQLATSADGLDVEYDAVMGGEGNAEVVGLAFTGETAATFRDLTVAPSIAGQYSFEAMLASSADANVTLNAYVLEEGEPVLVEAAKFTANTEGAATAGSVVFNVTDSMVGKQYVFGLEQADGSAVTLSGLTFARLGDAQDPDPVLVKEWTAKDLGDNAEASSQYVYESEEVAIGYRIFGQVPVLPDDPGQNSYIVQWSRADVMTGPLEKGTIMEGDEIRFGGYFAYDEGLADEAGVGFTMFYDDFNVELCSGMNMKGPEFMSLEEQYDDEQGFAYRDVYQTYTVASQDVADKATASGFKILIGDFNGPHYDVSPQTVYGFYVYNVTQDLYLFQKNGGELLTMGWTKNEEFIEPVTAEYYNTDVILGISFRQTETDQSLFEAPLTAEVESAGAYRLDLNDLAITGEGTVTVDVGVMVDGVLVPLASKAVTADDASVSFNVTADMAANPVGFAIRQGAGASTSLSSVSLSYLRRLDASEDNADVAAAFEVATAIAKLPTAVTLDDEAAVTAANDAYGNLTEAQQALVANAGVLQAAVDRIAELKEGKEAADEVTAMINALPDPDALTLENETAVNEAKAAYDALSDTVKTLVDEAAVTKLNAAVEKIAQLKADKEAADAVIAMINALPEADAITEENREAVEAAREAYDALTETQKGLVGEDVLAKLEAAEAALDGGDIAYGDVNNDGSVNASDALECLQHSVKLKTLEGDAFTAADVDLSGTVNATDALYILQFSVKLINTLPVK